MYNEYFGVPTTRNNDFLMHYGVKGMRWGVKRAIAKNNKRSLERHYNRSSKKLAQLINRANRDHQENIISKAGIKQRRAARYGIASAGLATIATVVPNMLDIYGKPMGVRIPVGAIAAAGSIIGRKVQKTNARKRISDEGHKKAISEMNNFRNEMKKTFKNTKYSKVVDTRAKQIAFDKRQKTANYLTKHGRAPRKSY